MPHICMDEVLMFMAMLPFIGAFFRKLHAWWHKRYDHKCHHKLECQEHHLEHPALSPSDFVRLGRNSDHDPFYDGDDFDPFGHDQRITKASEEDMKYLRGEPVPLHITFPVEIEENKK